MKAELLRLAELHIEQPPHRSLCGVHLLLRAGECCILAGAENSGKYLLTGFLAGGIVPAGGTVWAEGDRVTDFSPEQWERARHVYYLRGAPDFLRSMDLSENFFLMRRNRLNKLLLNRRAMRLRTTQALEELGLHYAQDCSVERLDRVDRVLIGIARAVDQGAKLIVLEDISQGLSLPQAAQVLALLRRVKQRGVGILLADNWSGWFEPAADWMVLLQEGEVVRKLRAGDFARKDKILPPAPMPLPTEASPDRTEGFAAVLEYHGATVTEQFAFGQITLLLSEDQSVLDGCWQALQGGGRKCCFLLDGERIPCRSPASLRRHRILLWSRRGRAARLQENMTTAENILLPSLRRISRGGFFEKTARRILQDRDFWGDELDALDLTAESPAYSWEILFCRWKLFHPRILVVYGLLSAVGEDTQERLYTRLRELCRRGTAVILLENTGRDWSGRADRVIAI